MRDERTRLASVRRGDEDVRIQRRKTREGNFISLRMPRPTSLALGVRQRRPGEKDQEKCSEKPVSQKDLSAGAPRTGNPPLTAGARPCRGAT